MAYEIDVLEDRPGGTGIAGQGISFYKKAGAALLAGAYSGVVSDADGRFAVDTDHHPGPLWWKNTNPIGGETWRRESQSVGLAGAVSVGEAWLYGWALGGANAGCVVKGFLNELAVTTAVSGLNVRVRSGGALVAGVIGRQPTDLLVVGPFAAVATPGNSRIDTVVVRAYPHGVTEQGRIELQIVQGSEGTSPSAPALTRSLSTYWEMPLADVRLAYGDTAIAVTAITDRRPIVNTTITDPTQSDTPWTTSTIEDHFEDFAGWNSAGNGSVNPLSLGIISTVRYGVMQVNSGASNGDKHRVYLGDDATAGAGGMENRDFDMTWIAAVETITSVSARLGFASAWAAGDPTDGVYFQFDPSVGTAWRLVTRASSVETLTAVGGAVVAATFYRVRARRVGSTVYASVDGGTEVSATTNIPSANLIAGMSVKNSTASQRRLFVDWTKQIVTGLP